MIAIRFFAPKISSIIFIKFDSSLSSILTKRAPSEDKRSFAKETLPILPWWNAIAINDVPAQSDFYSTANGRFLNDLVRDAQDGEKVALLYKVWRQRLSYRVVRTAEESKIALSDRAEHAVSLPFISDELATAISQDGLETALAQPLQRILEQVQLALENGKEKPDVIYLTGGSARSPLIKKALAEQLPGIPVAGGDDFGSVTAGLARWAQVMFS